MIFSNYLGFLRNQVILIVSLSIQLSQRPSYLYEYDNHYQLKSKKYIRVSVFGFIAGLTNAI